MAKNKSRINENAQDQYGAATDCIFGNDLLLPSDDEGGAAEGQGSVRAKSWVEVVTPVVWVPLHHQCQFSLALFSFLCLLSAPATRSETALKTFIKVQV